MSKMSDMMEKKLRGEYTDSTDRQEHPREVTMKKAMKKAMKPKAGKKK